ncbi:MAG: amino acid permease [Parvularcula sp.]|nr:amino acid permease [Parvularcula sp.]
MKEKLHRVLGGADIFFLAFGAMVGWSWVVLAGEWLTGAGFVGAALAFAIGGSVIALIGLTYAELASAMPYAGGEHVYVERAFGPTVSFFATWAIVLGYVSVVCFEAIALPVALVYLFPDLRQIPLWNVAGYDVYLTEILIGSFAAALICGLNIIGVQAASFVQKVVIILVLAAGVFLITGGFVSGERPAGTWVSDVGGVAGVLVMTPFLFVGFDVIPQSAEEIKLPKRKIGTILITSIVFATIFYIGVMIAVGFAPISPGMDHKGLAAADAANALWKSEKAGAFVILAGVAGILTSWNAFLIGGSRALFAMARAGQLPSFLGRVHPRYSTPYGAILLIGLLALLAPLLGRNALIWLVNAGGFGIIIAYFCVAVSFLALRIKEPEMERPYRAPAGFLVGTIAAVLSLALAALYMPGSPAALLWPHEWGLVAGWGFLGLAAHYAASRRH